MLFVDSRGEWIQPAIKRTLTHTVACRVYFAFIKLRYRYDALIISHSNMIHNMLTNRVNIQQLPAIPKWPCICRYTIKCTKWKSAILDRRQATRIVVWRESYVHRSHSLKILHLYRVIPYTGDSLSLSLSRRIRSSSRYHRELDRRSVWTAYNRN